MIGIVHFGAGIEAAHKINIALAANVCERNYNLLSVDMNWHGSSVERSVNELIQARVEGVIVSHIQEEFKKEHIDLLTRVGIPVVIVNGEERANTSSICNDAKSAFHSITQHLLQVGHRRILQLLPATQHRAIHERMKGFKSAFKGQGKWMEMTENDFFTTWPNHQITSQEIVGMTITQDPELYRTLDKPVYKFCKRLFATKVLPDAIVCTNDMYAIELIAAGLEFGVRVPKDMAITGYDNDRIGEYPAFGLTTAAQDIERICSLAVEEICRRIAHPKERPIRKTFASNLILRTSCGRNFKGANSIK